MTESTGQTGTEESTGTAQAAPPPFHVPDGSTCVADCDDAPLGWSTPTVGAANLPTGAQGGGGDMIGCWQVAQTSDPHGDSATSALEEIMQLYVSADGSGGNQGVWFRVRDGSFTSWTSLISAPTSSPAATEALAGLVERATQAEADAGTDNERYMTPSLVKRRIDAIPRPSSASTSRSGLVELATTTEADAGTDNTRAMTPALVKRRFDESSAGPVAFGHVSNSGNVTGAGFTASRTRQWDGAHYQVHYSVTLSTPRLSTCVPIVISYGTHRNIRIYDRANTGFRYSESATVRGDVAVLIAVFG